jgi:hypothetical protein
MLALLAILPLSSIRGATNSAPEDEIPQLRPPRSELPASVWEQDGPWIVAGGVVSLALAGTAVWFLARPRTKAPLPPEVQVRRELEPLRSQPEDGFLLSRVSQSIRRYAAAAFGLPPTELTTTEFCRAMSNDEKVGPELTSNLTDFLRECDRRKFAPNPPAQPIDAVGRALKLIELAEARRVQLQQKQAETPAPADKP